MKNIMVDLETMSTLPDAAIVAVGAVEFDEFGTGKEFSAIIDLDSSMKGGCRIDASTVKWWLQQDDDARAVLYDPKSTLADAMHDLITFVADAEWQLNNRSAGEIPTKDRVCVWGNGSDFDIPILANAMRAVGCIVPWKYNSVRCYRTLSAMLPQVPKPTFDGTKHSALDDARNQARHASMLLKYLKEE